MRKLLSTSDVARLLGVAVASVAKWIDQGELPAGRTPGGHRRVDAEDLVAFLHRQNFRIPSELGIPSAKVLIVDDEPPVTKWIAEEIAADHGDYEILQAHDGFAAGELVGSEQPDVVILDLRMPGMDGYEVCRRIKARGGPKQIAVIAMTAQPSPEAETRILSCGARVCLTKPLDRDALLHELAEALRPGR